MGAALVMWAPWWPRDGPEEDGSADESRGFDFGNRDGEAQGWAAKLAFAVTKALIPKPPEGALAPKPVPEPNKPPADPAYVGGAALPNSPPVDLGALLLPKSPPDAAGF